MGKLQIFSSANDLVLPQNHKVGQGLMPQQVPDRDVAKNRLNFQSTKNFVILFICTL